MGGSRNRELASYCCCNARTIWQSNKLPLCWFTHCREHYFQVASSENLGRRSWGNTISSPSLAQMDAVISRSIQEYFKRCSCKLRLWNHICFCSCSCPFSSAIAILREICCSVQLQVQLFGNALRLATACSCSSVVMFWKDFELFIGADRNLDDCFMNFVLVQNWLLNDCQEY